MAVGKIGSFDIAKDNWDLYIDRLEQFFIVNDVKAALRVATLITVIGSDAYELMVNLCTPKKPVDKPYSELVVLMKNHLQPRPSELAERFKFRQRIQASGEKVSDYMAGLKKMSRDCCFTAESLNENLRDQFVCGLVSDSTRQRLFAEEKLSLESAFQLAVAMEAAELDAALVDRGRSDSRATHLNYNFNRIASVGSSKKDQKLLPASSMVCRACGGRHDVSSCRFKTYVCRVCNLQGHLRKVCPSRDRGAATLHNVVQKVSCEDNSSGSDEVDNFSIILNSLQSHGPYMVDVRVNNVLLPMEIDTGSAISCISSACYDKFFANYPLVKTDLSLRYYTGELVLPRGKILVSVNLNNVCKKLELYVVFKGKTSLLGRQWLKELGFNFSVATCNQIVNKEVKFNLADFSSRYFNVFADGLGKFTGGTVGFRLRGDVQPMFLRARPLAYALREPVEKAIDQMVKDGILTPVSTSDWATPIVPVMKKDGTIRICADFKVTLNKFLEVDRFPLPRVEDLLIKLQGGAKYSKIDLSQAYAQFELDESRKFAVINTHKGLFQYNRLIFGLASSPGIFQRKIEQLFGDMPNVGVFLDDVIISGVDDRSHMQTLHEVFSRLQKYGLKIRKDKCTFFADSVVYLGFVISKEGVHTCPEKVEAINKVPAPSNVSELRSFLGLVMYYAKFVPNISTLLAPLYNLLRKEVKFVWDDRCAAAFSNVKKLMVSSKILAHYAPDLPLVLTTDASSVGVGAVISHLTPEGERPIAYASRVLNSAEKSYSQIDREALGIIFGVRKFHQYLYGRKFTLKTDHKPLVSIFGDKAGIPIMAASRLQRWAVLLSGYNYDIEYVRSEKNSADALSRLPVGLAKKEAKECTYLNFIQNFLPISRKDVCEEQGKDDILKKVVYYLQAGWPANCSEVELKPFFVRRNELYLDRGCIVWGYRIVIPGSLRSKLLKELHLGHQGMVKMKGSARGFMWWPGIDGDIESACRQCSTCAAESAAPPRAPPQPWPFVPEPWSRLHVDFLGPLNGNTFLVLIDSTSKWLEIFRMSRTTANAVITVLREVFARFGLPREIVSDNGPPFSSSEYANFMANNGIKVTFAAAYHPSSNGAAEGAVKLCKRAIKKSLRDRVDLDAALQTYLLAYRNSSHSTTGVSPAMQLQRRNLRSRLDLLKEDRQVEERVHRAQRKQVEYAGGIAREFQVGDSVWARNYTGEKKWVEGQVSAKLGSRNYVVGAGNGPPLKRHVDQMRSRWLQTCPLPRSSPSVLADGYESCEDASPVPLLPREANLGVREDAQTESTVSPPEAVQAVTPTHPRGPSLRNRDVLRPPRRLGYD